MEIIKIIRNHKALLCSFAEVQSSDRDNFSPMLCLYSGKLKVMPGNDMVCARGLYQNPRNVDIKNKQASRRTPTSNTPELDHNDPAASERVFVLAVQQHDRGLYTKVPVRSSTLPPKKKRGSVFFLPFALTSGDLVPVRHIADPAHFMCGLAPGGLIEVTNIDTASIALDCEPKVLILLGYVFARNSSPLPTCFRIIRR